MTNTVVAQMNNTLNAQLGSVAKFLTSTPTGDEFCQWLVTQWMPHLGATGALLHIVRKTGSLALIGSFGYPIDQVEAFRNISLWEPLPLSDAARDRQPVILNGASDVARRFPHLSVYFEEQSEASLAVEPICSQEICLGVVGVSFNGSFDEEMYQNSTLPWLGSILAVYMTRAGLTARTMLTHSALASGVVPVDGSADGWIDPTSSNHNTPAPSADGSANDPNTLGAPLTERQLQILHLMADGKTNPLIAYMLGYSESTVRHESMRIFKKLGVASRAEAVQVGKQRGLVQQ